jgi:hypothetical protein
MPPVGFEPTIPVFRRAKTIHTLDLAATVIGLCGVLPSSYVKLIAVYDLLVFYSSDY